MNHNLSFSKNCCEWDDLDIPWFLLQNGNWAFLTYKLLWIQTHHLYTSLPTALHHVLQIRAAFQLCKLLCTLWNPWATSCGNYNLVKNSFSQLPFQKIKYYLDDLHYSKDKGKKKEANRNTLVAVCQAHFFATQEKLEQSFASLINLLPREEEKA